MAGVRSILIVVVCLVCLHVIIDSNLHKHLIKILIATEIQHYGGSQADNLLINELLSSGTTSLRRQTKISSMNYVLLFQKSFFSSSSAAGNNLHERYRRSSLSFLHIPKTGGSSIEDVASRRNISWGMCVFPRYKPRAKTRCPSPPFGESESLSGKWTSVPPWWHIPRQHYPLASVDPYLNAELFAVVRDVYQRMVSEFYYKCGPMFRGDVVCNKTRRYEPEYMNEWMQDKLQEDKHFHGHFAPQYAFVVAPNQVRMADHVLRLENITTEFALLMKAYSLKEVQLDLVHNAKKDNDKGESLNVDHFNVKSLQMLHGAFAQDFVAFGYKEKQ